MSYQVKKDIRKPTEAMRHAIAESMVLSWGTSPKCDYFMKCRAEKLLAYRSKMKETNGIKISPLAFAMRAVAKAIPEYPLINSSYDFKNKQHIMHQDINVGFVVSTGNGLIIPNVKNTDTRSLENVESEIRRMVNNIEKQKLIIEDFTSGSVSVNNMGSYDRMQYHSAIINQPELAMISIYRIHDEAVVEDGTVIPGKVMNLAISADHRVIDGGLAYAFLNRVCEYLEDPKSLI